MHKKGKIILTITIGLICFILTLLIFIQFKTISQTDVNELETMRKDELKSEIASLKAKYEEMTKTLEETNKTVAEYEQKIADGTQASELLSEELKKSKDILGKNDIVGKGIVVTLEDQTSAKITAEDLIELLNELRSAGAEAISINDQRIVYDSYVVSINGTYISVNGERTVSPYVVKAIGDEKYLESGLSQKQYGYIDKKLADGKNVSLKKEEKITINHYTGNLNFEYVKEEQ